MEKTIKINLGGVLFQIEEDAYRILRDYLQSIDNKLKGVPGGNETLEDIEFRIAEIFQTQKDLAGVITRENVESMISIVGKPEEFDQSDGRETYHIPYRAKRMYRNPDDRIIGGVCGGMGAYLNTDPVWFRLLFIVFTLVFLIGLFVYLALWIALPLAETDSQKRDLLGSDYYSRSGSGIRGATSEYSYSSRVGSAFNEVFRAIGKILFIIARAILIIAGVVFVLAGFTTLFSFIIIFVFKYPGAFAIDAGDINLAYLPDFLNYIVTPAMVPLMTTLIVLAVALPLLAMIYGGVRLIFWFRARDGYVWLIGLVVWVISLAALAIISFNEGISYAERGETTSLEYLGPAPDTLYIMAGQKISDLEADKEISVADNYYRIYIDDVSDEIYITSRLDIYPSDDNSARIEIERESSGKSRIDAEKNASRLKYDFTISGDTLFLDEFFMIDPGCKWSFDEVSIDLYIPEGTIVCMDRLTERMRHNYNRYDYVKESGNQYMIMSEDGVDEFAQADNQH